MIEMPKKSTSIVLKNQIASVAEVLEDYRIFNPRMVEHERALFRRQVKRHARWGKDESLELVANASGIRVSIDVAKNTKGKRIITNIVADGGKMELTYINFDSLNEALRNALL